MKYMYMYLHIIQCMNSTIKSVYLLSMYSTITLSMYLHIIHVFDYIRDFPYNYPCICLSEYFMYLTIRELIGAYLPLIDRSYWWPVWRLSGPVCRRIGAAPPGVSLVPPSGPSSLKEEGIA